MVKEIKARMDHEIEPYLLGPVSLVKRSLEK